MGIRFFLAAFFAILLSSTTVLAQLGPKDGARSESDRSKPHQSRAAGAGFSLEDAGGKTIALSEFRDKKTVVLVFYRGYW